MNRLKHILFLSLVFLLALVVAFYCENSYRVFVRQLFHLFQGDKIVFVGKDFHLFASPYLLVGFGLFCVASAGLLYGQSRKKKLIYPGLGILLFLITTMVTAFVDSTGYIVECTACQDGVRKLRYNTINYDFHFVASLAVGLLPLLWVFVKRHMHNNSND